MCEVDLSYASRTALLKKIEVNKNKNLKFIMEVDNEYFKSYQDLDIHQLMLEDKVRNEAYRDAILSNKEKFKVKCSLIKL